MQYFSPKTFHYFVKLPLPEKIKGFANGAAEVYNTLRKQSSKGS